MHSKYLLFLIVAAIFFSCKKERQPPIQPLPSEIKAPVVLLNNIVVPNLPSPYYHFEYDGSGKVSSAAFASGAFTYSLFYQANQLKEMKSISASTKINTTYQYDNTGKISLIKISSEDRSQVFKRAFLTYNSQNRLTEIEWELNTTTGFIRCGAKPRA